MESYIDFPKFTFFSLTNRPDMIRYLKSLTALDGALGGKVRVEGRLFKVSS